MDRGCKRSNKTKMIFFLKTKSKFYYVRKVLLKVVHLKLLDKRVIMIKEVILCYLTSFSRTVRNDFLQADGFVLSKHSNPRLLLISMVQLCILYITNYVQKLLTHGFCFSKILYSKFLLYQNIHHFASILLLILFSV